MAATAGEVSYGNGVAGVKKTICLLAQRTTTNGTPSGATAGHPTYEGTTELWASGGAGAFLLAEAPGDVVVHVSSTAGSGTMTCKVTLWGYLGDTNVGKWFLIKALNGGSDIAETDTDLIRYHEVVSGVGAYDRLYAQLASVAGTNTAIDVHMTVTQKAGR